MLYPPGGCAQTRDRPRPARRGEPESAPGVNAAHLQGVLGRRKAEGEIGGAGATAVCLQLTGQPGPMGPVRAYGERMLPALRRG